MQYDVPRDKHRWKSQSTSTAFVGLETISLGCIGPDLGHLPTERPGQCNSHALSHHSVDPGSAGTVITVCNVTSLATRMYLFPQLFSAYSLAVLRLSRE